MNTNAPMSALRHHVTGAIARGTATPIVAIPAKYQKIRFANLRGEHTAGLIIVTSLHKNSSLADLSRLFPYSESGKMTVFQCSPEFEKWDEAFAFEFPA